MTNFVANNADASFLSSVFFAYLGGVLASLTPCVYPMVPIILGVIGASRVDTKIEGITLSLSYAAGLAAVYGALGIFASMTGRFFGDISTSPWSYLVFGNFCIVLAAWMMDWINVPFFSSPRTINKKGHVGALFTGAISGLVAAPCTSPVLAGLLLYVSQTKDILWGGLMLLAFSFGMTTLLVIIGAFSGVLKSLPQPGRWMIWMKRGLALILFITAEYFIIKAGGLLI
ncbi:MAG: hypothetical protein EPN22_03985 [Nitrospirae bacterium]|nr:MAG: hypothetical protein EPN22_03985 [Nitrospirota bacterium]